MKKTRLSEKLILWFVLLGLGAIAIVSLASYYSTKKALTNRTFNQLISVRTLKKHHVEEFYSDRFRDASLIAGTVDISKLNNNGRRVLHISLPGGPGGAFGHYFSGAFVIFEEAGTGKPNLEGVGCLPGIPSGSVIGDLLSRLKSSPVVVTEMLRDHLAGTLSQFIAVKVPSGQAGPDQQAILVLSLSMQAIDDFMLNRYPESGMGATGKTFLVGPDFRLRSESGIFPETVLVTTVKTVSSVSAQAGRAGSVITTDYRGIPVLSSYERLQIPGLSWVILAEIDVSEAMIPIFQIRSGILVMIVIILVVFFGFVLIIARRITGPIVRLNNATLSLVDNLEGPDLPVTTRDEIGELTESFNTMARQIRDKTRELKRERSRRMRSVIDGEEMERQRLSRELHDGIGQQLIAITLRLESLLYQDQKDMINSIRELKKNFDSTIDEVRRISNNLMPSVLEAFGIKIAFRNLFSETEEHSGLKIHFEAKGSFDDLDQTIKTYVYRMTQEALSNIVKHAVATDVWVNMSRTPDRLNLVIRDNGRGFSTATAGKEGGNGIHNMRERVNLLLGQIEIQSAPGKGTVITVNVPIITDYVNNQDFPRG